MEKALRRLLLLTALVAVLAGIEYFTAIDVPGFDLERVQREVTEAVDVPGLPDELPSVDVNPDEIRPRSSSADGAVEGPHLRAAEQTVVRSVLESGELPGPLAG
jgi:hypothetical protein